MNLVLLIYFKKKRTELRQNKKTHDLVIWSNARYHLLQSFYFLRCINRRFDWFFCTLNGFALLCICVSDLYSVLWLFLKEADFEPHGPELRSQIVWILWSSMLCLAVPQQPEVLYKETKQLQEEEEEELHLSFILTRNGTWLNATD